MRHNLLAAGGIALLLLAFLGAPLIWWTGEWMPILLLGALQWVVATSGVILVWFALAPTRRRRRHMRLRNARALLASPAIAAFNAARPPKRAPGRRRRVLLTPAARR